MCAVFFAALLYNSFLINHIQIASKYVQILTKLHSNRLCLFRFVFFSMNLMTMIMMIPLILNTLLKRKSWNLKFTFANSKPYFEDFGINRQCRYLVMDRLLRNFSREHLKQAGDVKRKTLECLTSSFQNTDKLLIKLF